MMNQPTEPPPEPRVNQRYLVHTAVHRTVHQLSAVFSCMVHLVHLFLARRQGYEAGDLPESTVIGSQIRWNDELLELSSFQNAEKLFLDARYF